MRAEGGGTDGTGRVIKIHNYKYSFVHLLVRTRTVNMIWCLIRARFRTTKSNL